MAKNKPKTRAVPPAVAGGHTPKAAGMPTAAGAHRPKTSVPSVGPDSGSHRPTFSFRYADWRHVGDWSWPTGPDSEEVLNFLCEMGCLTWQEVWAQKTGEGKRGGRQHFKHHFQAVATLEPVARERLAALHLDETFGEDMFRFRVGGEKRLWGFIADGVFYLLWWDVSHKVYVPKRK